MENTIDPRYPVGKYVPQPYSEKQKDAWLADILFNPRLLEMAVLNLDESQLNTPYREEGWTVKQLVHHVADSHMNAYMRFKLGLTEDNPTIKPYKEAKWAELSDSSLAINISLTLLHCLINRWYDVMKHMNEEDWQKTIFHTEHQKNITLWHMLGMYAWHGKHHLAHVTSLREKMGW